MSSVDWGSVADWFAAAGTIAAAASAVWLGLRSETGRKREVRERATGQARYVLAASEEFKAWATSMDVSLKNPLSSPPNSVQTGAWLDSVDEAPLFLLRACAENGVALLGTVPTGVVGTIHLTEQLKRDVMHVHAAVAALEKLDRENWKESLNEIWERIQKAEVLRRDMSLETAREVCAQLRIAIERLIAELKQAHSL